MESELPLLPPQTVSVLVGENLQTKDEDPNTARRARDNMCVTRHSVRLSAGTVDVRKSGDGSKAGHVVSSSDPSNSPWEKGNGARGVTVRAWLLQRRPKHGPCLALPHHDDQWHIAGSRPRADAEVRRVGAVPTAIQCGI